MNDPFLRAASHPAGKNVKLRGRSSTGRERDNGSRRPIESGRLQVAVVVLGTGWRRMRMEEWASGWGSV